MERMKIKSIGQCFLTLFPFKIQIRPFFIPLCYLQMNRIAIIAQPLMKRSKIILNQHGFCKTDKKSPMISQLNFRAAINV